MDKRRFNLWIDRALVPVFVGMVWTGLELHAARHAVTPSIVAQHSARHIAAAALFLLLAGLHLLGHWGWYRALKTGGCKGRHRRMVLLFSIVFLLVAVSGLILLLSGAGRALHFGIFHYLLGLIFVIMGLLHLLKRLRILFGTAKPKAGKSR